MSSAREVNGCIAASYDLHPWSQNYAEATDPPAMRLLAQYYGGGGRVDDVLDLGCGTGSILSRAGLTSTGRLVGTDISLRSCERARAALRQFGARAEVLHADILDLDAMRLGKFDLIYCTGVINVAPPEVRERLLELIGQCLRPGGAALISYYAGLGAAVRAHLAKIVRSLATSVVHPHAEVAKAREIVDLLRPALHRPSHFTLALRDAFRHFDRSDDRLFFFEAANGAFEAISTAELNRSLEQGEVEFATYLGYSGFKRTYTASDRAMIADRLDLTAGAHRHALFVKRDGQSSGEGREVPTADSYPTFAAAGRQGTKSRSRAWLRRIFWLIFRV
jgi:SAM-dependent methyltransferase